MLQQTQVKTVIPYFNNFVKKVPTLKALSKSNELKVLKLWEGLGYYTRARNLHKTSKILVKKYKGQIPENFEKLKELPGIGDYTANILLALIHNQPRIARDGNVKRVLSRIFNQDQTMSVNLFKTKRNSDLAEALIEFGALVCKSKNPTCEKCNIKNTCFYYSKGKKVKSKNNFKFHLKSYDIFCYLKKNKKQIALTKSNNLGFLKKFSLPKVKESSKKIKTGNFCAVIKIQFQTKN